MGRRRFGRRPLHQNAAGFARCHGSHGPDRLPRQEDGLSSHCPIGRSLYLSLQRPDGHIKKIKEKPDEVKRVIRAGIKANRYMRANRDGTIPVLMSTYRIDKEVASAAYDSFIKGFNLDGSMPEDGFRRLLDDTKRLMKIDREVALSEVADLSILREAQRELGIK